MRWSEYGTVWVTSWLGDAGGDFVVAPLILLWKTELGIRWDTRRILEACALAVAAVLVGWLWSRRDRGGRCC